jgi:hypothetical protein
MVTIFGFDIGSVKQKESQDVNQNAKTFAPPANDDGALQITSGSFFGQQYLDLDGIVRNEVELITRYRDMSQQPELETAIDNIVNEAIVMDDEAQSVDINSEKINEKAAIKKRIKEEFDQTLKLLNFGNMGHEIFRRWYVDGRLFYHVILHDNPAEGIQELRYIDPRRIRKIREVQKTRDPKTGMEVIARQQEYYLYNERGLMGVNASIGAKIATDAIINVNSGLMDSKRSMVLSYLHKAIKPLNQLRMVEDATVIYRLSRAPERRVFYVDVGNMSSIKAEQYIRDIMVKYRNKLVYDSQTGEIRDDRRHLAMLEDFWLPRREGSKGTEISTLPGGMNLGQLEDVKYFEKKLYKSLGVPIGRLEASEGFSLGRTTEVTRDELMFTKFIQRLRNKFSTLFDDILRLQLILKRVCTDEEWSVFKEDIIYDYKKDNNFNELKETELLMSRLQTLQLIDPMGPYVGKYYSLDWIKRHVLHQDEEEIEEIAAQIEAEKAALTPVDPTTGMPLPTDANGNPLPPPAPPMMGPDGQPMPAGPGGMPGGPPQDPAKGGVMQSRFGGMGNGQGQQQPPPPPPPKIGATNGDPKKKSAVKKKTTAKKKDAKKVSGKKDVQIHIHENEEE